MRKSTLLVVAAGFISLTGLAFADIPFFWLDKPTGRTNVNDPNSPNHPSLPIAPAGTPTSTPTMTTVVAPTFTFTAPPVGSTNTFTLTQSPIVANTSTFTPTQTAIVPTATPTSAGPHGSSVGNAEEGSLTSDWCTVPGTVYISADGTTGPSIVPAVAAYTVTAGGSTLPGGSSANAYCYSGTIGNTSAAPYPYAVLVFDLVAGWTHNPSTTLANTPKTGTDLTPFAPANCLSFSLKSNSAGQAYKVDLPSDGVGGGNYNYFEYQFTPVDTAWHRYTVYFPDGTGAPKFAQAYPPLVSWATEKTLVGGVRFQPITTGTASFDYCVDDVTFAAPPTPTPTVTQTATPNYSPTATPTNVAGFSGIWYDGDTAGAMLSDVTLGNDPTCTVAEQASGGFSGKYILGSFSVAAAGYYSAFDIARGGLTGVNVSAFDTLDFKVKVPSSGGGCLAGAVVLVGAGAAPNAYSKPVTITVYTNPGGPVSVDQWIDVRVPMAAFTGPNYVTAPAAGSFSAADFAAITAVRFEPFHTDYNADGSFTGAMGVDNVVFSVGAPAPAQHNVGALISDFEQNTASNWGNYWSSYNDQDVPDFACTPAAPSSRVFPSSKTVAPIVMDGTGGVDTPCSYGRIAGHKGGDGTGAGAGTCGTNNWSYAGMGLMFDPTGGSAAVDVPAAIGFTPSGFKFKYRAGPTDPGTQTYLITYVLAPPQNTAGGAEWQARISPTTSWQTTTVMFPAPGTVGNTATISATSLGQPSWVSGASVLTWDATSLTLSKQWAIAPENGNMNYDIEIDDLQFVP